MNNTRKAYDKDRFKSATTNDEDRAHLYMLEAQLRNLAEEMFELEQFHPRAMKLMKKKKNFIVIAEDEPYFIRAYGLIRQHEFNKGTWTEEDEIHFSQAFDKYDRKLNTLLKLGQDTK